MSGPPRPTRLHVVDASHPNRDEQIAAVDPVLAVSADRAAGVQRSMRALLPGVLRDESGIISAVRLSALTGAGLPRLRAALADVFRLHITSGSTGARCAFSRHEFSPLPTSLMSLNDPQWGKRGSGSPPISMRSGATSTARSMTCSAARPGPGDTGPGGGGARFLLSGVGILVALVCWSGSQAGSTSSTRAAGVVTAGKYTEPRNRVRAGVPARSDGGARRLLAVKTIKMGIATIRRTRSTKKR